MKNPVAKDKGKGCPTIARLAFVKRTILAGPKPGQMLTATVIAREWECTPKTTHRDLEFLREQLGHELVYDAANFSWRYAVAPVPVL
jgi:hypothetical protein